MSTHRPSLRAAFAVLCLFQAACPGLFGQTPSTIDTRHETGNVWTRLNTEAGYEYRLFRNGTLQDGKWFPLNDTFYGLGARLPCHHRLRPRHVSPCQFQP